MSYRSPTSDLNKARGSDHLTGENAQGVAAIVRAEGGSEITSALYYEMIVRASNTPGIQRIGGDAFVQSSRTATRSADPGLNMS